MNLVRTKEESQFKIGLALHICSTGGMRYQRGLISGLKEFQPNIQITLFCSAEVLNEKNFKEELETLNVEIRSFNELYITKEQLLEIKQKELQKKQEKQFLKIKLKELLQSELKKPLENQLQTKFVKKDYYKKAINFENKLYNIKKFVRNKFIKLKYLNIYLYFKFKKDRKLMENLKERITTLEKELKSNTLTINNQINKLKQDLKHKNSIDLDIIFFTWPFFIEYPELVTCPIAFIPHDFNAIHHFGSQVFAPNNVKDVLNKLRPFFQKGYPVVSSKAMAKEAEKSFGKFLNNKKVEVIYPAPSTNLFRENRKINEKEILKKFNINFDYILYPTNISVHKNVSALLKAGYILKQKGYNIKFILTGFMTDQICGQFNKHYIDTTNPDDDNWDIKGFGLISNEEYDIIAKNAKIIVTCSLYEAGNGPGIDAWHNGVPHAMSNIDFFTEHAQFFNCYAETFDPSDYKDIANKLIKILDNYKEYKKKAKISQKNIQQYTLKDCGREYFNFFKKIVEKESKNNK